MCEINPIQEVQITLQQRRELILDLTRRLELLDDLMRGAREKQCKVREQFFNLNFSGGSFESPLS